MYDVTIHFNENTFHLTASFGENLYDVLVSAKLGFSAPCGGKCFCGKCKVKLNNPSDLSQGEERFISKLEASDGIRLACATSIKSDLEVYILNQGGKAQILEGEYTKIQHLEPAIERFLLSIPNPSLSDQRSDLMRTLASLNKEMLISCELLALLPEAIRENKSNLSVTAIDNGTSYEVLDFSKDERTYGVAVDIGTTTMVAYLMDLSTGEQLAVASALNPQKPFGADVISRTDYTIEHEDGLTELSHLVVNEIQGMIDGFVKKLKFQPSAIKQIVVVGNTIMMHLFAKLPVRYIAVMPFIPVYNDGFIIDARELRFKLPNAKISITPCVAGYVGSDTLAAILACDMDEREGTSIMIDIGTNGEIALGGKGRMLSCSTAAGPAFEGAHIYNGMGGIAGAINSVKFDEKLSITTIGDVPPIGICGSGLVDAVSVLKDNEVIDMMGRIEMEYLPDGFIGELIDNKPAVKLSEGIYLTQRDMREVQLAKGSIAAGIAVLMQEMNVTFDEIDHLYLAGGFGNYIDRDSATNIGLLPMELKDKIVPIGNGAGTGARLMLLSKTMMARASALRDRMEYIELSGRADFQDLFVEHMLFE